MEEDLILVSAPEFNGVIIPMTTEEYKTFLEERNQ